MARALTDEIFDEAVEALGLKIPSRLTKDDWIRRELMSRPRGEGGRNVRREHDPMAPAEFYAGMATIAASNGAVTKNSLRYIRELALELMRCRTPQDVLAFAHAITRAAGDRDISRLGPDLVFYVRSLRQALAKLYGKTQPKEEKQRDEYFESADFIRLVFGITNKLFVGYRFQGDKLVRPGKKPEPEAESLGSFVGEPVAMSAKGRE